MTEGSAVFTGPELCALEAHVVAGMVRRGDISGAELLAASRARTEAVEPLINAMPTTCWDRTAGGRTDGPLAGVPLGIKDLDCVAGVRTTFGTPGFADFVPSDSDPIVLRIEAAGGVVVGKTNTPEMGAGANTFNEVFGATLNPWDTALNAGGSSGGAAAGLATGEVWLSQGSDHGGSLRTPAAYCGVVGLRPSLGAIPSGSKDTAFMMETALGPMARSVTDCAMFFNAMAGGDARHPLSRDVPGAALERLKEADGSRPRIAYSPDLNGFAAVDTEMAEHLATTLGVLGRNGATVEEVQPALPELFDTYHTLRGFGMATQAKLLSAEVIDRFKPVLKENIAFGQTLSFDDVVRAQINRSQLFHRMVDLLDRFDFLALPVVGNMPRVQSEEWVREVGGQTYDHYMDWLRFAYLATVTGLPALSVPVGLGPRGLPVGLQLIGKPRGEAELLRVARFVELCMGGPLGPIDPRLGA